MHNSVFDSHRLIWLISTIFKEFAHFLLIPEWVSLPTVMKAVMSDKTTKMHDCV